MNLLINTASAFKGGSVQVALSFLEECRRFDENEYCVVLGPALSMLVAPERFDGRFHFYSLSYRPATRIAFPWNRTADFLDGLVKRHQIQVAFTTSGPAYWRPKVPHVVGYNLPHYLYPESPYMTGMAPLRKLKWRFKKRAIRHYFQRDADVLVTQTEAIQRRLQRFIPDKPVHHVANTCSAHYFAPKECSPKLPPKGEHEFRFVSLSAWYPHKNLQILPAVIQALPEAVRLSVRFVLTLPEDTFAENFPEKSRPWIVNVGPVPVEEGPALYRECDALFLPTLLECFSASYPEAMAMGKPITTSDLDFARGICADAALYFDPLDPAAIASTLSRLVVSPSTQAELVEKGRRQLSTFGDATTRAEAYLNLCRQLVGA